MELRSLRYFVAVAEERNFTRAAARLGIQQPPLSRRIQQLEKEMGTRLFRRLTRGVELTGAGKLLLQEALEILQKVEHAKISVRRRSRGETGQIKAGTAGGTYFHPLIGAVVREFRQRYPEVLLSPEEGNTPLVVAQLHGGQIDLAFVRPPIGDHRGLAVDLLLEEDLLVVLPRGHPFFGFPTVRLAALAEETFIMVPQALNPGFHDSIIEACHRAGFNPIHGQEGPDLVASVLLVSGGFGISIVPRCINLLHVDGIGYVPLKAEGLRAPLSLVYRRDDSSPAVRNFVAVARRLARTAVSGGAHQGP
ncbi:MAG: LysR substrate-binding domain-containing protein [Xanthobacteraceae bacterium]